MCISLFKIAHAGRVQRQSIFVYSTTKEEDHPSNERIINMVCWRKIGVASHDWCNSCYCNILVCNIM